MTETMTATAETVTTHSYRVLFNKLEYAVNTLNKFKRKVTKKHGVESFSFSYDESKTYIGVAWTPDNRKLKVLYIDITVTIKMPVIQYEGYKYIATLKIENIGNSVFPIDEVKDEDFSRYFTANLKCDHCHTNRYRKQTHIFRNEKGEDLQVANSCSQDYFGIDIDSKIATITSSFAMLGGYSFSLIGEDDMPMRGNKSFDIEEYTKLVYGLIYRDGGYRSRANSDETHESTSATAGRYTSDRVYDKHNDLEQIKFLEGEQKKIFDIADKNGYDFEAYTKFWQDLDTAGNTFLHNCRVAVFSYADNEGMRAYSVWHIIKGIFAEQEKKLQKEKTNEHIGTKGEKIELTLTVTGYTFLESQFGCSVMVRCEDETGNSVLFYDNKCREYAIGDVLTVKAKVKDHGEYKGKKQTTIFYVKY